MDSTVYGQYAKGEALKSLGKALEPVGGWESLKSSLVGFHGDFGNVNILSGLAPLSQLGSYLTNVVFGMSVMVKDLDTAFLEHLKQNQAIKFVVYCVGIGILPTKQIIHYPLVNENEKCSGGSGIGIF